LTLGEFDRATQAFGLATTLGVVSMTGIAGLTLGGGLGWLNGRYGLACDNLVSAEIATADGQLLRVSERENENLFWAIHGGGGNFGVRRALKDSTQPMPYTALQSAPDEGSPSGRLHYRALFEAVRPHLEDAVYVNNLGDEGPSRVRAAYGDNYPRPGTGRPVSRRGRLRQRIYRSFSVANGRPVRGQVGGGVQEFSDRIVPEGGGGQVDAANSD
jgi:hypothetical protein